MYCLLRYLLNVQFVLFSLLLVWLAMLAGSKYITYSRHWLLSARSADLPALSDDVTTHIGLLGVRRHRGDWRTIRIPDGGEVSHRLFINQLEVPMF